ncbi:hypothetical protein ACOI1C_11505 [Bacillus sp. DJP31]|uniref:hypothetical protein n=1 Tax=Bacillus sp. DJP31 TaxID=3409789 RepID=UPI003BB4D9FA
MNKSLKAAILGGIIGGVIFGIMMQMMGMIPMIAMMAGSESLVVGWLIHMIISIIFAGGFVIFTKIVRNPIIATITYGVILWVIGPLLIMPMMLGMGSMISHAFAPDQMMSLLTHIFFTVILAIVNKVMKGNTINTQVSA